MKLSFTEFNSYLSKEGLVGLQHYLYAGKKIPDYTCRPNGKDEVKGYRYEWPEFVLDNNTVSVTVHHIVTDNEWSFIDRISVDAVHSWHAIEEYANNPECSQCILHRSKKSNVSLSRYISSLQGDSPNGTSIQRATDAIMRHMKCDPEKLEIVEVTGDDIVEWYRDNENDSHSCMTGHNCEKVAVWGTNSKQCRLLVLVDPATKRPISRCLIFRPCDSMDVDNSEVPVGPGWYYGRIYSVGYNEDSTPTKIERAIAFMTRLGMLECGHTSARDKYVPLIQTEYAPYIDRGILMFKNKRVESKVIWLPPHTTKLTQLEEDNWRHTENNQYGSAWGRTYPDDSEEGCYCQCCESCDTCEEDMYHVAGYGSVCPECIDGGSFVMCIDDEYRHIDDTLELYSTEYEVEGCHAESRRESVTYFCRMTNGSRTRIRFVAAYIDSEETSGFVPESEVITDIDGTVWWSKLAEDGDIVKADYKLKYAGTRWVLDAVDEDTGYVSKDNTLVVMNENGELKTAYTNDLLYGDLMVMGCVKYLSPLDYNNQHNPTVLTGVDKNDNPIFVTTSPDGCVVFKYENHTARIVATNCNRLRVGDVYTGQPVVQWVSRAHQLHPKVWVYPMYMIKTGEGGWWDPHTMHNLCGARIYRSTGLPYNAATAVDNGVSNKMQSMRMAIDLLRQWQSFSTYLKSDNNPRTHNFNTLYQVDVNGRQLILAGVHHYAHSIYDPIDCKFYLMSQELTIHGHDDMNNFIERVVQEYNILYPNAGVTA